MEDWLTAAVRYNCRNCVSHDTNVKCSLIMCVCVSGLLHPGDLLVEVNGNPVVGLEPEQIIQILVGHLRGSHSMTPPRQVDSCWDVCFCSCQINSQGTILFKVIPDAAQSSSSLKAVRNVPINTLCITFCTSSISSSD